MQTIKKVILIYLMFVIKNFIEPFQFIKRRRCHPRSFVSKAIRSFLIFMAIKLTLAMSQLVQLPTTQLLLAFYKTLFIFNFNSTTILKLDDSVDKQFFSSLSNSEFSSFEFVPSNSSPAHCLKEVPTCAEYFVTRYVLIIRLKLHQFLDEDCLQRDVT